MDVSLKVFLTIEITSFLTLSFILFTLLTLNMTAFAFGLMVLVMLYLLRRFALKIKHSHDIRLASRITERTILENENRLLEFSEVLSNSNICSYVSRLRYEFIERSIDRYNSQQFLHLLDVGCGDGNMLVLTAKKGLHCVGLDLSKKHLNSAKERLDRLQIRERVSLVLGSAQHLPFRFDAFDLIILSEVLEHLLNPQECIIEARSVTRRGGVLILTTINAARITLSINPIVWIEAVIGQHFSKALSYRSLVIHPENPLIHRDFTADELRNLFQGADFSVLEISSLGFSIFYQVSYFVGPSLNVFTGLAKIIERIGAKMPVVKNLGYHFCVVCRRA